MNHRIPGPGSPRITAVETFRPVADGIDTRWSCTRCGTVFAMHDSHLVKFTAGDHDREVAFVVCPDCAVLYRHPTAAIIDLTRMPAADEQQHEDMRQVTGPYEAPAGPTIAGSSPRTRPPA